MHKIYLSIACLFISVTLAAQDNRIDIVRPDAPELASFGAYDIGVRTLEFVDQDRVDVLNTARGGETAYYARSLVVEIWYPAQLGAEQTAGGQYQTTTRNPAITATLNGKAVRDAEPNISDARYPLVILSHGYPGNRYLMSPLGENLASKGYVVASIDHSESTYEDQQAFPSTLYNRPLDQRFVLDTLANLAEDSSSFLNGLLDANSTGIVGYSMGGYGLVNNLGGGYSDEVVSSIMAPVNGLLKEHATGNPEYRDMLDPRIKAGFAVAPWGMNTGFWRAEDLAGINVPTFYLAGDADTTAGYEEGTRAIFENAVNSDRYLLTFKSAGHSAGAPYPLPVEIINSGDPTGAGHYTDPVWDTVRMNNIMDHFATAYFDHMLKNKEGRISYLQLVPDGADGVYSVKNGQPNDDHTYWKGFGPGEAVGLKLEHLSPGQ
jgi:predicted dienelactone hydrolase